MPTIKQLLKEYVRLVNETDEWGDDDVPTKPLRQIQEPQAGDVVLVGGEDGPDGDGSGIPTEYDELIQHRFRTGSLPKFPGADYYEYDAYGDTLDAYAGDPGGDTSDHLATWNGAVAMNVTMDDFDEEEGENIEERPLLPHDYMPTRGEGWQKSEM